MFLVVWREKERLRLNLDQDLAAWEPPAALEVHEIEISRSSRLVSAPSSVNGEHFLCFAHASQRVPTHRQQWLSHSLRGLHE
jgi:hypothetical protein